MLKLEYSRKISSITLLLISHSWCLGSLCHQVISSHDIDCMHCRHTCYTPHTTKLLWGILVSLRPSVRLSVRPASCVHSVASTVQDGFFPYLVQMINSMRGCVACDDPWPWPISSRSFGLDLENRVRSVASTVLDGFFIYLAQIITIIRGCVACCAFFRIWKFEFLANLKKNRPWPWKKIYSSLWILSIFSTNDH